MLKANTYGVLLIAIFFAVATLILLSVGTALVAPGSPFEAIWLLYPARRSLLLPYRTWLGPGFLILAFVMASASIGCFRHRRWGWGWWLAVAIFSVNGLGDAAQLLMGHLLEGGIGVSVAAAILYFLSRREVRETFT